jgi:DNA-binding transcriptional regulator YhcF (GntR family)
MNASTHPVAHEEVMAFLDGELTAAQGQSVSDHLKQCAACSNLATQLGETRSQLTVWPVGSLPPATEAKILEAAGKLVLRPYGFSPIFFHQLFSRIGSKPILALCGVIIVALLLSNNGITRRRSVFDAYAPSSPSPRFEAHEVSPMAIGANPPAGSRYDLRSGATTNARVGGGGSGAIEIIADDESPADKEPAPAVASIHQPMIARGVSLTILTRDFTSSRAKLEAILALHHGYSAELTASTAENSPRSIAASLRVPANELAAALAELKSLGNVETESQSGEEVTQQHADLVARLKNSRETEQRLQTILLQRTGKISDVLAVEQEIARVRGEIEQMEAEQKSLEHRVDFTTIELRLSEEYKAQLNNSSPSASTRIHNSLVAGYNNAAETLLGFVLFFAESGPTLLIWLAILLVPALLLVRRYRRAAAAF